MAIKKSVILIPYWIEETLQRNPVARLSDCLDFPKLRPLVAAADLAGFAALQKCFESVFGCKEIDCDVVRASLPLIWGDSLPNNNEAAYSYLWNTVCPLEDDPTVGRDVACRLFDEGARLPRCEVPYALRDLSPTVLGVVIYPGFFVGADAFKHQLAVTRDVLKTLYVYDTHSEVAKTSLFKRYLELLRDA